MFSRLIIVYKVWEEEKSEHAEYLIRKTTLSQGIAGRPLVLHSDNSSLWRRQYLSIAMSSGIQTM